MKKLPKMDIGLMWAKLVNVWGQLGTVAGVANTLMLIGVFYTTTVLPNYAVPLWLYIMVIVVAATFAITFIVRYGISGYYRFFSSRSELSETNRRIKQIMDHLGIEENDPKKK